MHPRYSLDVVFLTNFSNAGYRAIPALAQMADEISIRLTLLHVCNGTQGEQAKAEANLQNFFPEADSYRGTRRHLMTGSVLDAVRRLHSDRQVDLVVAPSSDPLGVPNLLTSSRRAELIASCPAAVWTMGSRIHNAILNRPTRNVGCVLDVESSDTHHLGLAVEFASAVNAQLHLLHAIPEIDEGSLTLPLRQEKPLFVDGVLEEIRECVRILPLKPGIHVETGSLKRVLPRLAGELDLDAVFVAKTSAVRRGWRGLGIHAAIDRCPCPVICGDERSGQWRLKRGPAFEERVAVATAA